MKHVIVEGPDGAGKSTLVRYLTDRLDLVLHKRASTSVGGPVPSLIDWYAKDAISARSSKDHGIYDRHPLISEPIYARYARHEDPQPPFDDHAWLFRNQQYLSDVAFMVWCMPPYSTVLQNVSQYDQMPGVVDNIKNIYTAYLHMVGQWRGFQFVYDYTRVNPQVVAMYLKGSFSGSS